MENKKLRLGELKVKSFVTNIRKRNHIKGGNPLTIADGVGASNECHVDTIQSQTVCDCIGTTGFTTRCEDGETWMDPTHTGC